MDYEDYPDDYSDEEEYQDNYLDAQREMFDEAGGNYPSTQKPESLFSLFKSVWSTDNSSKVANLDTTELGFLNISVRDCQRIALFSKIFHHKKFGKCFNKQAEITLSTSMSKKGWFVELFVTSKKFAHKGSLSNLETPKKRRRWTIFGPREQKTESNQQA